MSELNIEEHYIQLYREGLEMAFQQKDSRLRPYVMTTSHNGEFEYFDRLGVADDVNEIVSRYGDTPMNDVPHDRRRIGMRDFDWAKLVDKKDLIRVLTDPTSPYTQAAVMSFNRKIDDVIIENIFGTAQLGKTGSRTISFVGETSDQVAVGNNETTEGITVSDTYKGPGVTPAATNLTIAKLRAVKRQMMADEVIDQEDVLNVFMSANQFDALLREEKIISADYNVRRRLEQGAITDWGGFRFIHTERLPKSGDIRSCVVSLPKGLLFAEATGLEIDVGPRRDKRNIPQIYIKKSFNATRMWGECVARVLCDETK